MACLLFIDFDASLGSAQGTGPANWPDWAKPPGVYHYSGIVAQNQVSYGSVFSCPSFTTGRNTGSTSIGVGVGSFGVSETNYNSSGGFVVGANRSAWGIGTEVFCSMDIGYSNSQNIIAASTANTMAVFRFGDIAVFVKSATLILTTYTVVFSVKNNGSEIATITVPNVTPGTTWSLFKMACKLDATTGYINCTIDGVTMSSSYTGHNTVAVIAAGSTGTTATADHVYFGSPCMQDTSSHLTFPGCLDNIYIDDTAVPTHRPRGQRVSLSGSSTDVSAAAVGTSATTIIDALGNPTDAKAARFTGAAASTIMDLAAITTTGLETNVIGFNLYAKRPANRDANVVRYLSMGVDISGVQTMGTLAVAVVLPVSTVATPPNTDYPIQGLFDKVYNASITTSNLANVKIRLLTS